MFLVEDYLIVQHADLTTPKYCFMVLIQQYVVLYLTVYECILLDHL